MHFNPDPMCVVAARRAINFSGHVITFFDDLFAIVRGEVSLFLPLCREMNSLI
jgi:hypothetical protein